MRRTSAAVIGTLSGTALLLAAKFGTAPDNASDAGQAASAPGDPGANAPMQGGAAPAPSSGSSKRPSGSSKPAAGGLKAGTFTGAGIKYKYGTMQVTITVAGGRLTNVTATYDHTEARTEQVNSHAIPILRKEALTAQSAHVDSVSGASFTSPTFRSSLQTALTKAQA